MSPVSIISLVSLNNYNMATSLISINNHYDVGLCSRSESFQVQLTCMVLLVLLSSNPNSILSEAGPDQAEQPLPRITRRTLAQLCAGKSPLLISYLHK